MDTLPSLAKSLSNGRHVGVGFSNFHEPAPGPPDYLDAVSPGSGMILRESATAELTAEGRILVRTQQSPHGQGHETTYAQIAADEIGVSFNDITVVYANTAETPFGSLGTGGSRGAPIGGGAVRGSAKLLRDKIMGAAADCLEESPDDIVIMDGRVHVAGVPTGALTLAEVARSALDSGAGVLQARKTHESSDCGWSAAVHACFVDVDLETGFVAIPRYIVVEDCGPLINPAIVDGQIRGGVAQGLSSVLLEKSCTTSTATSLPVPTWTIYCPRLWTFQISRSTT